MTYAKREEIFSKDYLTIADLQELLGLKYQGAAEMMRNIKRELNMNPKYNGQGIRLDLQGKLHVQDYLDYFNIKSLERYSKPMDEAQAQLSEN
jgi:hypothetical protein